MKGRKTGGVVINDRSTKPERRNNAPKIMNAAEAMKKGGKVAKMEGEKGKKRADRMARKAGGRTGSPFSAAAHGTPPKGHQVDGSL